ncbi:MAG: PEP-utilizing enzyme [Patescibacteria group bacterium]
MVNIKKTTWDPIFTREGFSYFIASLAFDGYIKDMPRRIGWGYRDQLLISKKNILTVYGSLSDQKKINQFCNKKNKSYFLKVNQIILTQLVETKKVILKVNKLLEKKKLSVQEMAKALDLFYNSYRSLYSVYRFSTLFDHFYQGKHKVDLVSKFAQTKDQCGKFFTKTDKSTLEKIKQNLGQILGIPKELILGMNYQELAKSLQNNSAIVGIGELKRRQNFYILIAVNRQIKFFFGQTAKLVQAKLSFVIYKEETNVIFGQAAYAGRVVGLVKVAYSVTDLRNIKKGMVLVTPMTTISYVPFLNKVLAIITDEGGVTSHAAIVARELKIPSIVGTKIATRVLKDGDLVEVDANHGVVTILKRK